MNILELKQRYNKNWEIYKLNLSEFTNRQKSIVTKYEPEETLKISNLGCKEFIKSYDKYILHCIEELSETREAEFIYNATDNDNNELLYEVVDILMYLGSMQYIIQLNCNEYNVPYDNMLEINYSERNTDSIYMKTLEVDSMLMDINDQLIAIRRLWPHRKWHKPYKEFTSTEIHIVLTKMLYKNLKAIEYCIQLYLFLSNENYLLLNKMVNKKEKFIFELPKPEGE